MVDLQGVVREARGNGHWCRFSRRVRRERRGVEIQVEAAFAARDVEDGCRSFLVRGGEVRLVELLHLKECEVTFMPPSIAVVVRQVEIVAAAVAVRGGFHDCRRFVVLRRQNLHPDEAVGKSAVCDGARLHWVADGLIVGVAFVYRLGVLRKRLRCEAAASAHRWSVGFTIGFGRGLVSGSTRWRARMVMSGGSAREGATWSGGAHRGVRVWIWNIWIWGILWFVHCIGVARRRRSGSGVCVRHLDG